MAKFKRIKTPKSPYMSYLLMLAAPAIVAWYYYGAFAFRAILTGVVSAAAVEAVALLIMKRNLSLLSDMHAVFTGLAVAMLLPATAPVWLIASGAVFAVLVAKIPFGPAHKAPFVPAAAGIAFLTVCFPDEVFKYPAIDSASFDVLDRKSVV